MWSRAAQPSGVLLQAETPPTFATVPSVFSALALEAPGYLFLLVPDGPSAWWDSSTRNLQHRGAWWLNGLGLGS